MNEIISKEHGTIRLPVVLLSDEKFLKLTSRLIDVLFALAYPKYANKSVKYLADALGMRPVNFYREKAKLEKVGFIHFMGSKVLVKFPLDYEITGSFRIPGFLVQERLSTEEWRLILVLYKTAYEQQSAAFILRNTDLCAFAGIEEKNISRVRRKLVEKGLVTYSRQDYTLTNPATYERIDTYPAIEDEVTRPLDDPSAAHLEPEMT